MLNNNNNNNMTPYLEARLERYAYERVFEWSEVKWTESNKLSRNFI
jgi:hypothetical protein